MDDNYTVPRLALGQDGLLRSSNNYFVIQAYPKNNNPQNYEYPYVDIAYRLQKYKTSENVGDVSNIKMYGDGVTRLSPVKTLEITTNFKNGSYNGEGESLIAEFGSSSSSYYDKYMDIPAIRNTQTTNGLILAHRNANDQSCFVRVNCDNNGDRFFRPLTTDGNISLGSDSYRWNRVFSVNADYVSSDRRLKENIEYLQETPNIHTTKSKAFTLEDMYNFVKDTLYLTSYNYKEGSKNLKFGLIAQDLLNNKIGDNIIEDQQLTDNEETSYLGYDTMNYTHTLAGALKVAINEIEKLKEEIRKIKADN